MTEHTLMSTTDAMVWAEEFCRIFDGGTVVSGDLREAKYATAKSPFVDEGTMVGWFANAMGVGEMFYRQRLAVTAQRNEDGTIEIVGDLPSEVIISDVLLMEMIDQHNREVLGERT